MSWHSNNLEDGDYYDALYAQCEADENATMAAGAYWNGEQWVWPDEVQD